MKSKSFSKKLDLNKSTVSNLGKKEMNVAQGGDITDPEGSCYTRYREHCMSFDPDYCPPTSFC